MAQQPPNPRPGRPGGQGGPQGQAPDQSWRWVILVLFGLVVAALLLPSIFKGPARNQMTYGDFFKKVQAGQVKQATVNNDTGHVTGTLSDDKSTHFSVSGPHPLPDSDVAVLKDKVADLEFSNSQPNLLGSLLPFLLPLRVFVGFWLWMSRRAQGQMTGLMSIGRSKEKVYTTERPRTTFADVAGYGAVKQEIREVVDFLKSPGRFRDIGARIPKGVLLVGPPGTGKTLLARAVAGEAGVPFMSVTGSDFMEMFVGVGASRVRDLFQT